MISGGYELASAGRPSADNAIGGGTANGVFVSGGGTVQLDALLSQFAGVISGFDLGEEIGHQSLGFASATPWMRGTSGADVGASGVDKGGLFSLTLLGQYAANFSAGGDGHGGTVITDASVTPASSSLPLIAPSPHQADAHPGSAGTSPAGASGSLPGTARPRALQPAWRAPERTTTNAATVPLRPRPG